MTPRLGKSATAPRRHAHHNTEGRGMNYRLEGR